MPNKTRFTGNLVSDDNIFSDIVNDRVGIGTTSPRATLHVRNDLLVSTGTTASYDIAIKATTSDSGTLSFEDPDSTKQYFYINKDTSTLLAINKSDYEPAFLVNAGGSVGIGTTNPTSKLHVIGDALVTGISTLGLGNTSTPPNNSQMSFELTSNTNLRIKVRGTDGVLRSGNITLA